MHFRIVYRAFPQRHLSTGAEFSAFYYIAKADILPNHVDSALQRFPIDRTDGTGNAISLDIYKIGGW